MSVESNNFEKNYSKKINGLYIDPGIFTFKFSCNCSGECCHYGVYTDLKEHDMILSIKDKILPLFDESQTKDLSKWFEPPEEDDDFEASGLKVTSVIRVGRLAVVSGEILIGAIGQVSSERLSRVKKHLSDWLSEK